MKKIFLILALISAVSLPGLAGAWTLDFSNHYADTNAIYLWMETPAAPRVLFETTTFGSDYADWALAVDEPTQQVMLGPAKPQNTPGISINFTEPSNRPFSFQWAEVKWSGSTYEILGGGTSRWNGNRWRENSTFSHENDIVPIPVPASVLLLGTGILGLGLLGWRRRETLSTKDELTSQEGPENLLKRMAC